MNKYLKNLLIFSAVSISSLLIGLVIGRIKAKPKDDIPSGTIYINKMEADEPENIFLELSIPVEALKKLETGLFKISNRNYISH